MNNKDAIIAVTITLIAIIGLATILSTIKVVSAGTVGIVTRFGEVTDRIMYPGLNFKAPFIEGVMVYNTKKVTYETAIEKKQKGSRADYKDYPVDTNTEDGQPVDIAYTIRFSVDPKKAPWIANNIGSESDLVEKVVKAESRVVARNIPRGYSAEKLYTGVGSEEVQTKIEEILRPSFKSSGIDLDMVGIREIYFPEEFVSKIKERQNAAIEVETAKEVAERAKYEKQARITKAEGQAREQELQRQTISNELLQKIWIQKWDGKLPRYMLGDSKALLQLPK